MAIEFSKITDIVIPEGNVTKITDTNNTRTIWTKGPSSKGFIQYGDFINSKLSAGYWFFYYKQRNSAEALENIKQNIQNTSYNHITMSYICNYNINYTGEVVASIPVHIYLGFGSRNEGVVDYVTEVFTSDIDVSGKGIYRIEKEAKYTLDLTDYLRGKPYLYMCTQIDNADMGTDIEPTVGLGFNFHINYEFIK